jgi:hypothetical protein
VLVVVVGFFEEGTRERGLRPIPPIPGDVCSGCAARRRVGYRETAPASRCSQRALGCPRTQILEWCRCRPNLEAVSGELDFSSGADVDLFVPEAHAELFTEGPQNQQDTLDLLSDADVRLSRHSAPRPPYLIAINIVLEHLDTLGTELQDECALVFCLSAPCCAETSVAADPLSSSLVGIDAMTIPRTRCADVAGTIPITCWADVAGTVLRTSCAVGVGTLPSGRGGGASSDICYALETVCPCMRRQDFLVYLYHNALLDLHVEAELESFPQPLPFQQSDCPLLFWEGGRPGPLSIHSCECSGMGSRRQKFGAKGGCLTTSFERLSKYYCILLPCRELHMGLSEDHHGRFSGTRISPRQSSLHVADISAERI